MSTWAVERTGDGRIISWNGKPIHYRINWDKFSSTQRLTMNEAIADVCPRVGSGHTNDGQTTRKPLNSVAVRNLDDGTNLYIYARDFALIDGANPAALAMVDKLNIGDELVAAILVHNTRQMNEGDNFKAICYHEMGHVVGLEHPTVTTQLMSPALTSLPWKSGDLDGFAAVRGAH
jgi:hypothetical protein